MTETKRLIPTSRRLYACIQARRRKICTNCGDGVVFSVLIGNLDDHLRNHGFLYDRDGRWRLSPAYDLNPLPLAEKARELTTWISEQGPEADLDLAREATPFFSLKKKEAEAIIDEVSTALKDWQSLARRLGMSSKDIDIYSTAIQGG